MNQSINLSTQQTLQQTLSPQMIQSLKLLQVNSLQLEQIIKQELEINPILEETQEEVQDEIQDETQKEETDVDEDLPEEGDLKVEEEEIDWEEYLKEGFDIGYRQSEDLSGSDEETFQPVAVAKNSLEDYLTGQLNEKNVAQPLHSIVQHLIGSLDVYGYLTYSIEEIANDLKVSVFHVEEALNILQTFEPVGIGARNLRECLTIQLRSKSLFNSLEMDIVNKHFELLQKFKISEIANAMGRNINEIQEAIKIIGTLNPRPGESLETSSSQVIIPDLIVEKISGEFVVYLNDSNTPHLQINRTYAKLIGRKVKTPREIKGFIREKMNTANWLIKAIEQRKTTMLRVMKAIIKFQHDFFEKGATFINPLVMQTVADYIEMHISTISRVANGKYVQTPHGVFELKYFFSAGVEQKDGAEVSSTKAMAAIKELINNEDTRSPLSDQKIVEILKKQNIDIARRTVAKYRDRLKFLPARMRKRY